MATYGNLAAFQFVIDVNEVGDAHGHRKRPHCGEGPLYRPQGCVRLVRGDVVDAGRLVFDLHSVCTFQRCCSAMTSVVHRSVRACVPFSCVRWHSVGMFRDRGMETSCSRLRDVCVGMNGMRM